MNLVKTQPAERVTSGRPRLEELYVSNAPSALRTAYFLTGDADLADFGTAPPDIVGRIRRRQKRTAFTAATIALAVAAVSVGVSVRAIDMRTPDPQPARPGAGSFGYRAVLP